MPKSPVEVFLEQHMGLDVQSVGSAMLYQAQQRRMAACGLDEEAYIDCLRTSRAEQKALVDAVVVLETWFFRNHTAFDYLREFVRDQWPTTRGKRLQVLTVPCATGEEAYSIAITLVESGLRPEHFRIDALDICERALDIAQAGIYGTASFRGEVALKFRDSYFETFPEAGLHGRESRVRVVPWLQATIRFQQGNLLHLESLRNNRYDVVFCRNLLIYLTEEARTQALQNLEKLLPEHGLLFLGHAERGMACEYGFEQIPRPGVFACRKPGANEEATTPFAPAAATTKPMRSGRIVAGKLPPRNSVQLSVNSEQPRPPGRSSPLAAREGWREPPHERSEFGNRFPAGRRVVAGKPMTMRQPAESPAPASLTDDLEQAQRLADQGRLEEARLLCERYLQHKPDQVPANFLMGVVHQALDNNPQAETYFNKTLYLDPNHQDALNHLAFLVEKRGQAEHATRLRQRLQRLRERE